jgi:hypothetical protein
VIIRKS